MYKHVLIATDGSELADRAVEQGLAVAKGLGARVTVLTVSEVEPTAVSGEMGLAVGVAFPNDEYERAAADRARMILEKASSAATAAGVPCDTLHVPDKMPAETIVETAASCACDLIVMASHGRRGLSLVLLGSQTSKVLSHTSLSVLVIR